MILSLIVWFAMQAQGTSNPEIGLLICNYCGQYVSPLPKCSDSVTTNCDCGKPGCALEKPKPAVQGQVQRPWDDHIYDDSPIVQGYQLDDPGIVPQHYQGHWMTGPPPPAPTEHVIEIKTRREPTGKTWVCSYVFYGNSAPTCDLVAKPTYCPTGYRCEDEVHVTRELWIDGVKYGIVKGLE